MYIVQCTLYSVRERLREKGCQSVGLDNSTCVYRNEKLEGFTAVHFDDFLVGWYKLF